MGRTKGCTWGTRSSSFPESSSVITTERSFQFAVAIPEIKWGFSKHFL